MMTRINTFIILIVMTFITSCGSITKSSVFRPDDVRLNVGMEDLEYLGETEISVSYSTYLGFISVIDKVNGEDYSYMESKTTTFDSYMSGLLNGKLKKAAYKALEDFPEATYFIPVYRKTEADRLFLGREVNQVAKIRAYKFKD
ncbi:hypothetical protein [Bacteroides caecigallinarum]|uniref:hypothetical protein n=1 Tax=Bacteroides caecigallinarum TaxID=1411144 RepID=UPI001F3C518C|nr:hypothetical protein [Bacteroides caecigallinarum]